MSKDQHLRADPAHHGHPAPAHPPAEHEVSAHEKHTHVHSGEQPHASRMPHHPAGAHGAAVHASTADPKHHAHGGAAPHHEQPSGRVARVSHFNDPIPHDGKPHGYSRASGDAPPEVKQYVVKTLIDECHRQGLGREDTAHVLAIARLESGFNPDAAAQSSSACGVGQFISSTGEQYGLHGKNRFDLHENARAMVEHYRDNKELAQAHGKGEAFVYKYYHDGPHQNSGGLELAHKEVLPYIKTYESALDSMSKGVHHAADSMKVFLADTGHSARDFFHGLSERAHSLTSGGAHHELAVARGESPFQRDHLERVAFNPAAGTSRVDPLGLGAERVGSLAAALADTMRTHGFDQSSVSQSTEIAQALLAGVGARKPGQDVLVIHRNGDVLASLTSQHDAQNLARTGDTVLDLRTLDRVAASGIDPNLVAMARQSMPSQTAGLSNLEVNQLAGSALGSLFGQSGPRLPGAGRGMEMA